MNMSLNEHWLHTSTIIDHSSHSYYQYHHKLHSDSCIMYCQVTQNKLKTFKSYWGGDTRQILDNLWKEDNLWREDKGHGPKVSSVRRFYCRDQWLQIVWKWRFLVFKAWRCHESLSWQLKHGENFFHAMHLSRKLVCMCVSPHSLAFSLSTSVFSLSTILSQPHHSLPHRESIIFAVWFLFVNSQCEFTMV